MFWTSHLSRTCQGGATRNLENIETKHVASCKGETPTPAHRENQRGKTSRCKTEDSQLAAAITDKLDAGNFLAAIWLLCSDNTLAPKNLETLEALKQKNPNAQEDRRQPSEPRGNLRFQALQISPEEIMKNLRTFPAGSSGGPDGITPQHLLDLLTGSPNGKLKTDLTDFIHVLLSGNLQPIRKCVFGSRLIALKKKCTNSHVVTARINELKPIQVEVGVSGSAESATDAVRRFVETL